MTRTLIDSNADEFTSIHFHFAMQSDLEAGQFIKRNWIVPVLPLLVNSRLCGECSRKNKVLAAQSLAQEMQHCSETQQSGLIAFGLFFHICVLLPRFHSKR
eukprot:3387235-Amphidinium_carterae.1